MTNSEYPSSKMVDELLLDAGYADASDLRLSLLRIHSLAQLPVPAPGAELSAMLAGKPDTVAQRRRARKHRPTVVGVAVVAGMGLGVTGVAATSPSPRLGQGLANVQELTSGLTPDWMRPSGPANAASSALPLQPSPVWGAPETDGADSPESAAAEAPHGAAGKDASGHGVGGAAFAGGQAAMDEGVVDAGAMDGRALAAGRAEVADAAQDGGISVQPPAHRAAAEHLQHAARHLSDTAPRGRQSGRHVAEKSHKGSQSVVESVGGWLQKLHR